METVPCAASLTRFRVEQTATFTFRPELRVKDLRLETTQFAELKDAIELQRAFVKIRDAHVVKFQGLSVQANLLFRRLVVDRTGYARIPWGFSDELCYLRAEMGAAVLSDSQFPLPTAISLVSEESRQRRRLEPMEEFEGLNASSLLPRKTLQFTGRAGDEIGLRDQHWSWHVALAYVVRGQLWMLDPSLDFEHPLPFEKWYEELALNVPDVDVEIGWPFSLGRKNTAAQLSIDQCYSGSVLARYASPDAFIRDPGGRFASAYVDFQTQTLKRLCKGKISEQRARELLDTFWQVAGTLTTIPEAQFMTP